MDLLEKPANQNSIHPWEIARAKVATSLIKKYSSNLTGKKVLDLGCGDLFFLKQFSKETQYSEFYAVDIAFNEEDLKKDEGPNFFKYRSLDEIAQDKKIIFDIVFIMDVVEHIQNDLGFLKELKTSPFVSNKTIILITVPAFQSLFTSHDTFLGHYRRYNNTRLKNLTNNAGFIPIEHGYFFSSLLVPRYLESLKERIYSTDRGIKGTGLTRWKGNPGISKSIARILYLDFLFQRILKRMTINLPGLSNYIICKKSV